jgi:F-box/WD-40 domain protein 4
MYVSKIILDERFLFMSHRGQIRVHERTKGHRILKPKPLAYIADVSDADITWFAKEDSFIFAGRNDGSVFIYNCENENFSEQLLYPEKLNRITSVDLRNDFYATTTASSTTNFWKKYEELGLYLLEPTLRLSDNFETIKICPQGTRIAGGKYHDRQKKSLRLIDIET